MKSHSKNAKIYETDSELYDSLLWLGPWQWQSSIPVENRVVHRSLLYGTLILLYRSALWRFDNWSFLMQLRVLHQHCLTHNHTNVLTTKHIHPFYGPLDFVRDYPGEPVPEPIWILLKHETVSGSGISWATCQICTLPQTTVSMHWRQINVFVLRNT